MNNPGKNENQKPLILLVDDLAQNIQMLHQILNNGDYSFAVASSGTETLELVEKRMPDLILLDIMLGDIDGFEVCSKLKKNPAFAHIPIIFLTAKVELEDKIRGFQLGAVDYITKPFENAEVLARVQTHIQLKKSIDMIVNYNRQVTEAMEEMKQLQQKLLQNHEEAVQKEKEDAVKAMVVTTNHEFNQPLTILRGCLDLFKDSIGPDGLTPKQKQYLENIEHSLERILTILEKFRESSTIEFGEYLPQVKMVLFGDDREEDQKG